MADRLEFKEKLAGILALAEGQNGKITVDEVEKYFEEDGLSQEQMNNNFLNIRTVQVLPREWKN